MTSTAISPLQEGRSKHTFDVLIYIGLYLPYHELRKVRVKGIANKMKYKINKDFNMICTK